MRAYRDKQHEGVVMVNHREDAHELRRVYVGRAYYSESHRIIHHGHTMPRIAAVSVRPLNIRICAQPMRNTGTYSAKQYCVAVRNDSPRNIGEHVAEGRGLR